MSKAAMNEEMFRQASALRDEGRPWQDIAKAVGYSGSGNAMQKLFTRTMARFGPAKQAASKPLPGIKQALGEMRQAKEKAEQQFRPKVTSEWDDSVDLVELWSKAEADSVKRIEKARKHSRFHVSLPSDRVSCITFVSDQHIAPGTPCDFKRMREDAELIAATKDVYAILGGDCIDGHIKHIAAVISARSTPGDQWQLFEYYLEIFKEKILAVTSGNHDFWQPQYTGVDALSWLCKNHRVAYSTDEARIDVTCGSQKYKVAMRHQYRLNSSFNQTHSVKQWLRLGEDEFDIGCIGHHHEAAVEQTIYRGKMVWGCRPGAYQITSAYSAQYGWNMSIPTCPSFLVFPDRRHIIGLADVRDVPTILRAFNG